MPCSPEQQLACPLKKHFQDTHHTYFPRAAYRTAVEKQFRELPVNKETLCRNEHNERHYSDPIPEKPDRNEMLQAIADWALSEITPQSEAA